MHQRRFHAIFSDLALVQQQGDGLDRLAQAHIVGQAGAQPPLAQKMEPRVATHLVGPQLALERLRRHQLLHLVASPQLIQQTVQPARSLDALQWKPCDLLVSTQGQAQRIVQRHLGLLALFLPEGDGRLDLVRLEQHPLAAYLDQGHFKRGQPLEFLVGQRLVAQGQFPIELHQGVHAQESLAGDRVRGLQSGSHAQPRARFVPPGGHQHAKTAAFQKRSHLTQEGVGFVYGQRTGIGPRRAQALHDRREEPSSQPQPGQQSLLCPLELAIEDAQRTAPRVPYLFGRHQQAGIIVGLEHVAQEPVGREHLAAFWVHFGWLQPDAKAEGHVLQPAQLPYPRLPGVEQARQITPLGQRYLNRAPLGLDIIPQRRPPRASDPFRRLAPAIQTGPAPIAHGLVDKLLEKTVQQVARFGGLFWFRRFSAGEHGPANRRHGFCQPAQACLVLDIFQHRQPARPGIGLHAPPCPADSGGGPATRAQTWPPGSSNAGLRPTAGCVRPPVGPRPAAARPGSARPTARSRARPVTFHGDRCNSASWIYRIGDQPGGQTGGIRCRGQQDYPFLTGNGFPLDRGRQVL